MKKVACECCKNRYGDYGTWVIYGSVVICESCRLAAMHWMLDMGFTFAHPFVNEITNIESPRRKFK